MIKKNSKNQKTKPAAKKRQKQQPVKPVTLTTRLVEFVRGRERKKIPTVKSDLITFLLSNVDGIPYKKLKKHVEKILKEEVLLKREGHRSKRIVIVKSQEEDEITNKKMKRDINELKKQKLRSAKAAQHAQRLVEKGFTGNAPKKLDDNRFQNRAAKIQKEISDKTTGERIYSSDEIRDRHRDKKTNLPNKKFVTELRKKYGYTNKEIRQIILYGKYDWYYLLGYITKDQWIRDEPPEPRTIQKANTEIAAIFGGSRIKPQIELKPLAKGKEFAKEVYKVYKQDYLLQGYPVKEAHEKAFKATGRYLSSHVIESEDHAVTLDHLRKMKANTPEERKEFGSKLHYQNRKTFLLLDGVRPFLPEEIIKILQKNKDMNKENEKENVAEAIKRFKQYHDDKKEIERLYEKYSKLVKDDSFVYIREIKDQLKEQGLSIKKLRGNETFEDKRRFVTYIVDYIWKQSHAYAVGRKHSFQGIVESEGAEAFNVHDWDVQEIARTNSWDWKQKMERADVANTAVKEWVKKGRLPDIGFTSKDSNYPYMRKEGSTVHDSGEHIYFSPKGRRKVFTFEGKTKQQYKDFVSALKEFIKPWALHYGVIIKTVGLSPEHIHLSFSPSKKMNIDFWIERKLKAKLTEFLREKDKEFGFYRKVVPQKDLTLSQASILMWQKGYGDRSFGQLDHWQVQQYLEGQMNKELKHLGLAKETGEVKNKMTRKELKKIRTAERAKIEQMVIREYADVEMEKSVLSTTKNFIMGIYDNPRKAVYARTDKVGPNLAHAVLRRDGFKCVKCGDKTLFLKNGQRNLQIEHKVSLGDWKKMTQVERTEQGLVNPHNIRNLQSMCVRCHKQKHRSTA